MQEELLSGQSSSVGTTNSQKRSEEKSSRYTLRQSTFPPLDEETNRLLLEKIKRLEYLQYLKDKHGENKKGERRYKKFYNLN